METISELDRISDLPSDLIDVILGFLSFKDAVRTSSLSKNWNEKWHTLPNIIIDKELYERHRGKLEGMINYILAVHEGRIEKFSVSVDVEDSYNPRSWLCTLQQKGIRELFLRNERDSYREKEPYEVPSILFSCQLLRKLSLGDCIMLKPPRSSTGFPSLISLEFDKLNVETDVFEKLISSCPLLEQLTLKKSHFADLKINVPKLKYLCFDGEFKSLCLNTPFLEIFSINVYRYYDDNPHSLRFEICGLPSTIKELYAQCEFQKLAACDSFTEVVTYSHLRTLQLDYFCSEKLEQVRCLLSLIGSSDDLTTLGITLSYCRSRDASEAITKFWEEQNNVPLMLIKLRKVRVGLYEGTRSDPEMKLIQYVMTNSPVLEEIIVECNESNFKEDEVKGVLQLLCKSSTKLSFIVPKVENWIEYQGMNIWT
ncbi:F-box/RNI-like/FBD-like domains-containing protein [Euphorbia peplus]|nr:F-box/RNI-like/FBD-like domains-containing protein [Euphorbia peplus]